MYLNSVTDLLRSEYNKKPPTTYTHKCLGKGMGGSTPTCEWRIFREDSENAQGGEGDNLVLRKIKRAPCYNFHSINVCFIYYLYT